MVNAVGNLIVEVVHGVSKLFSKISQLFILIMMVTTCYDVIMRYAFHRPTSWSVELNAIALAYITFLAGPELVRYNRHIRMELASTEIATKRQAYEELFTTILVFAFTLLLTIIGIKTTYTIFTAKVYSSGQFRIAQWLVYITIPLGVGFMSLEYLFRIWNTLVKHIFNRQEAVKHE